MRKKPVRIVGETPLLDATTHKPTGIMAQTIRVEPGMTYRDIVEAMHTGNVIREDVTASHADA